MAITINQLIASLKADYVFRLNLGNQKVEFHQKRGKQLFKEMNDIDFNSIKVSLALKKMPCSRENLRSIIYSNQWPAYDPYKEFLKGLPLWDGHDHIADLAATVTTDDNLFWGWCLKKWLVAFVGSLADEKTVNQTALIFCGKQGIGKSTWFMNILPPELQKYYSSGFLDPKERETLVMLSELCLFNMDEVENLKPRNVEAVKELITKPLMYLRRAYTTHSENYPRRCSFCGTANGVSILHDVSGNRRFLCQNVLAIDYQLKGIDLSQVYAQAYHLYRTGFRYWLDNKEQAAVEKHNMRFRAMSIEEELITAYYEPCQDGEAGAQRLQAHELLTTLQGKGYFGRLNPVTIGRVLASMGFVQKKTNGISKWVVRDRNLYGGNTLVPHPSTP